METLKINNTIKIGGIEYVILGSYQHPKSDNILLTLRLLNGKKQYKAVVYPDGICSQPFRSDI